MKTDKTIVLFILTICIFIQCDKDGPKKTVKNPDLAEIEIVDRFSDSAATLMRRSTNPDLPGANEPVGCDELPFITQSLGPDGSIVKYYNFDVQPLAPAPIFVLFKPNADQRVEDQLNIIDVIPGDPGYNDFWLVYKVSVPDDYLANSVTSLQEIEEEGYELEETNIIVNCPIVPEGSTASLRIGTEGTGLDRGWYKGKIVYYFKFEEKKLQTTDIGLVPTSPIYVSFNLNPDPDNPNSGPVSGFVTEPGSNQTHNVIATIPSDADYSPLWQVKVYDNAYFDSVINLSTAETANILDSAAAYVNCPVVFVE